MVLSSWPISSSFLSTSPMLSSICFMPASLTPQSLPPGSPTIAMVLVRQHGRDVHARRVVPDEEGLVGLLGVVAIEEVDRPWPRSPRPRSSSAPASAGPRPCRSGSSPCRRRSCTRSPGAEASGRASSLGSTAPGTSERPGIGVFLQGGATVCSVGVLLMSGKLTPCIASR